MGKSSQHVTQHKQERGGMSGGKPVPHTRPLRVTHKFLNRVEAIWESFPEGLIACDRNQKLVRINAAARKLFEMGSEAQCQGRDYQQFLTSYISSDEQPPFVSKEQWLMNLALAGITGASSPAQTLLLHLPSGRKISVTVRTFPMSAQGRDTAETVSVFHCGDEISYLRRVHEAMLDLITAIAQIPEQMECVLPEETFLLSPPVLYVAQQVVDIIQSVLNCHNVNMLAFGHRTGHLYYVAGTGWTAEQEQYWRDIGGYFHGSEMVGDAAWARLGANQEVVLAMDQLHTIERLGKQLPFPASLYPVSPGSETILFLPLFLEQQWVGVLVVVKARSEGAYTPEEIALVKAVTAQTMLLIEGIHGFSAQEGKKNRALAQQEVSRLAGEFLTLATHELRTPLTGIMGNLQLAQRRLQTFNGQFAPSPVQVREPLAHVQQPLAAASQSAQLQQRIINDLIDDARIQTHTLTLSLTPEDLGTLLREVVAGQQHAAPEHPIMLDVPPLEQGVPILADAGRIKHVLTTYLTNARTYAPPGRPVTVQLRITKALARVSVHNEGSGIAREDLDHIWERFYRAKGSAVQHELDLSFGLALYLCRVFIERHEGSVGVQSAPGEGATFWFTVPLTPSLGK
ncbi:PAS domain-containing sensor histidine kinase [Ktedonobacter racemifer]|uniref:histidine kinase n=1 Tax=Ktedonobacter racemifer DSM 44963 TaxID=485913 RepID=D6TGV6_KTERA|nr:PAS domain-containing sensor histidine kinase [Ktedonobacter racemifer]EFH88885.1 PAS/PAC sensor signal transduction histidine kinase [Ktedonobacter racemifer DSM 44963]